MPLPDLWGPFNSSLFRTSDTQDEFEKSRKLIESAVKELLIKCSPQTRQVLPECTGLGCSATTCRLYRGCLLFTAKTLTPTNPETDFEVKWLSLEELCQFHRHRVLGLACSYDRRAELVYAVLLPTSLLAPLVFENKLPEVGFLGAGTVVIHWNYNTHHKAGMLP